MPTSIRLPIFLGLAAYLVLTYMSAMLPEETAAALTREDGFFELLGALGFLITSILFMTAYIRSKQTLDDGDTEKPFKRLSFLLLALLFFFGAGEEVSWGQRFFSLPAPEVIREINAQGEFTIHNLRILEQDEDGALKLFNLRRMFNVFWLIFAVMIPLAAYLHQPTSRWLNARIPVGPAILAPLFLANWIVWKGFWMTGSYYDLVVETIEISESNFAILFVFFAIGTVWGASGHSGIKKPLT